MRRRSRRRRLAPIAGLAVAVPLLLAMQRPAGGGQVTWLPALDLQGAERALKDYAGPKGLVVFFWAGWSERSIEALARLESEQKGIRDRGVGVVAVNVEQESGAVNVAAVRAKASALGVTLPVVIDAGLRLFKAYGVVSVPSAAVVNDKGELTYFLAGYGHEKRDELFDAINRLAGVEPVRAEAGPAVRAAPAAARRLHFGRTQLAGGRVAAARSSFEAAAAADPAFADPLIELAALAMDEGDAAGARQLLDKAAGLEKDNAFAAVEAARLEFVLGRAAEAAAALETLAGRSALAAAYLGFVRTGDADAARRMTEYRRENAAARR